MRYRGIIWLLCCLPILPMAAEGAEGGGEENPGAEVEARPALPTPLQPGTSVGGGIWGRYLRLNLRPWTDASGQRMDREDLFYFGGKVVISGPLKDDSPFRWRFGGILGGAGKGKDDLDRLDLSLINAGLTSGLSWRAKSLGVSLDLSLGGAVIDTEIKRWEYAGDWDLYERRTVSLFYWEPLLSLDFQVADFFVIRLQGGYTFLYGKGKEVGGLTGGLALDFGQWM